MPTLRIEAHSDKAAARVGSPVRRKDTLKGRNKVYITVVFDRAALLFYLAHISDQTDRLCPRNGSSCHLNSAFQRVVGLVAQPVADRCQEAVLRLNRFLTHVGEHKAPCSISVLDLTWLEQVPQAGSLLVS